MAVIYIRKSHDEEREGRGGIRKAIIIAVVVVIISLQQKRNAAKDGKLNYTSRIEKNGDEEAKQSIGVLAKVLEFPK